jgi:hypothetical protein
VLLGDDDAVSPASDATHHERYVATEAFPGEYRILVRRAWGKVAADTITAEITIRRGTDREQTLRRQIRVVNRGDVSYARSLRQIRASILDAANLPLSDSDESRYEMLERLKRVLRAFGYSGLIVVMDRVDEPTLVRGDPDRMKAVVWPLLNNKFLQQEGLGCKLLLPMELRHAVFRESSTFFQEARLDKQSLIEHLSWTGATLYDLCESRINACANTGTTAPKLIDLFAEDVTRQDVVDSLDRLHQPRDAFKLIYRCMTEHCAAVTRGDGNWKIPRHILNAVVKQEAERVQQLFRGIRPG